MIIRYKGTDEHGVFRMGVTKLPNEATYSAWRDSRDSWKSLHIEVDGCVIEWDDHRQDSPSPHN